MSLKKQGVILALLCALGAAAMRLFAPGELLLYAIALPFDLAGAGLRALSLAGWAGNILAWCLYTFVFGLPVLQGMWMKRRGQAPRHWGMRLLLSAGLLYGLYLFINPAEFSAVFGPLAEGEGLLVCKTALAGAVCSPGLAWWVLCMVGRAERLALYDGLALLLKITGALLIFTLCYYRLYEGIGCFAPTGAAVYDASGVPLPAPIARAILGAAVSPYVVDSPELIRVLASALPAAFLLALVCPALDLLAALRQDPYGEIIAGLCEAVAQKARAVVYACLASMVGGNLLQLLFADAARGRGVHIGLDLPLIELALAFMLLLLADSARRNRSLKIDSDSII
ncbi:MAG: hypothetical protein VB051_06910 [Candidatus Pelethousia sp.]|nr:hypothetical protein [Candidatus Pelethousia sp.]